MKHSSQALLMLLILSLLASLPGSSALAAPGDTTIISLAESPYSVQADGYSESPSLSADGRYVAFASYASNLVSGDTNGWEDIFVHDRQTDVTERVSVSSSGVEANSDSYEPFLSSDGRYVAFASYADNLVSGDTNGVTDIFVHDRQTGLTERVSVDSSGAEANSDSFAVSISSDGRYTAFYSNASNLVSGDTNGISDIFVHDRDTGVTERVSVDSSGAEANSDSYSPSLSADGRYVAFESYASNLVSGDTNSSWDIFVHDRQTGATERVSLDSSGGEADSHSYSASLSPDGRYVAFYSEAGNLVSGDTNGWGDIFVHDRQTHTTERISVDSSGAEANDNSYDPSLSSDGRYVAFQSKAGNLVSGDTNGMRDIFIHDRQTGATERVSLDSSGAQANGNSYSPSLSADGSYVAFASYATNLVSGDTNGVEDIFVHDRLTGATEQVTLGPVIRDSNGDSYESSLSSDGRYAVFSSDASNLVSGDTNGVEDIFVHDRDTGVTERVSIDSSGAEANGSSDEPSLSSDGRYVAFKSWASNLVSGDTNGNYDIFVHDRLTGGTERVSLDSSGVQANSDSYYPSLSADGRYVAFASIASNLVSGDTNGWEDIFVHDRLTGGTERVSLDSSGAEANSFSYLSSLSADGRYVAFVSEATNLASGDTNGLADVFVHDRQSGLTERVSLDSSGVQGNGVSNEPSLSADGRYVAFESRASNLVSGDTNGSWDTFVHDRDTGVTERVSIDSSGAEANSDSFSAPLSADGRYVAFSSAASNLVSGDTNGLNDIFIHDRDTGVTERVSLDSSGGEANSDSYDPSLSADGQFVAFQSKASNLVSGDTNGREDIFVHENDVNVTPPTVQSINRAGPETTNASSVDFTVTFSEPVIGVDTGDFTLTATGVSGATVSGVSGSNDIYTVTVNTGSGNGTIRLDVPVSAAITDLTLTPLGGLPFTSGQTYIIYKNGAPTDISLSASSVTENLPVGTTMGTLTTTDPDAGDTHTYSFVCAVPSADDASFTIAGDALNTAAVFDYETKNSYNICIRTDDGKGGTFDKNFTITVTNVNEPPVITSNGGGETASLSVPENTTAVTIVVANDPDTGTTLTYSLSGDADAALFDINSSTGILTFLTAPNFESPADADANNIYEVAVQVSDDVLADTQAISVTVTNVNESPTDISLSNSSVSENQPIGTIVGTLSTNDPDAGDTHTYSFTCAVPGADDVSFQISGASSDELQTAAMFDYETKNAYNICIRSTDSGGLFFDKAFVITITDIPNVELVAPYDTEDTHTNRPTFQWNAFAGATQYLIQISTDSDFKSKVTKATVKAPLTSYTPKKNLLPNTTYYWRVAAKVGKTYGPWSETWSFTTGNPPPIPVLTAPGNKKAVAGPSPLFDWKDVKAIAGVTFGHYEIQISTVADFSTLFDSGFPTLSEYNGFTLPPGTYYWRVRSVADNGDFSAWSQVRIVIIQ